MPMARRRVSTASLSPVLDLDVREPRKILHVNCDQDEVIHTGNRGDLTIHVRSGSPHPLKARTFDPVPTCRRLVIRKHGERGQNHIL